MCVLLTVVSQLKDLYLLNELPTFCMAWKVCGLHVSIYKAKRLVRFSLFLGSRDYVPCPKFIDRAITSPVQLCTVWFASVDHWFRQLSERRRRTAKRLFIAISSASLQALHWRQNKSFITLDNSWLSELDLLFQSIFDLYYYGHQ